MRPVLIALLISLSSLVATQAAAESRIEVSLPQQEHDWVLQNMRTMLETIASMQGAMAEESDGQRLKAIAQMTEWRKKTHPETLHEMMPESFIAMSREMQKHWQSLRHPDLPLAEQLEKTQELLDTCNACHKTFYLSVKQ